MLYLGTPPTEVISQPVVRYELVTKKKYITYQELQFSCHFPPTKTDYYYQVIWYVEDTPTVITEPLKKNDLRKTNLGYSEGDPTKGYTKLGINV